MLIARALPIMKVYIKPGSQRGYYGHCINMPQKITELAHTSPRYPKDIPLILVTMKGKNNTFKNVLVRKAKVEQALFWLLKHNPHYRNVKIDTFALEIDALDNKAFLLIWKKMIHKIISPLMIMK